MSNFYVNWDLLVHRLLPSFMRFSMMELWLRVCVSPLAYTYLNLFTFRVNSKDLAAQNSQTIVLQTILRKQFNNNIEVVNNDNLIYLTRLYREQVGIEEPAVYRTKHNKFEPLLFRQEHINEINP